MFRGLCTFALLLPLALSAPAQTSRTWTLAANDRFEVYSESGEASARATLTWLERLRAMLVREVGIRPDRVRPARVIGFASAASYAPYRLSSSADAYYVGTEGRDYIVMSLEGPRAAGIAAHEYAHMALHTSGAEVPRWLAEGLAEVFGALGADRPEHSQTLRRTPWIPLGQLLRLRETPSGVYYAESWALADLLALSPEYGGKLRALVGALPAMGPEAAFASVYGRTLDQLTSDVRAWIERQKTGPPVRLAGLAGEGAASVAAVSPVHARTVLAQMLLDAGRSARAEAQFRELPAGIGDVQAALGTIAIGRGDRQEARERWTRALELGVSDDALCYRYAAAAQDGGIAAAEIRPVLERAIAIRPEFDDALYSLALIEKNAGETEAALVHLRAMGEPGPARAFAYWSAISDALNTLDRHDEAEAAAKRAAAHALTAAEKARAEELAYIAQTELTVQLARGHMVTTRIPRRTSGWNPFVEPLDDVRTVEGALVEIDCSAPATRFVVESDGARFRLAVPDPSRVQMKNAPAEFICGAQSNATVRVVFAERRTEEDDGIVRGMEFR